MPSMTDWRSRKLSELIAIRHGFAFKSEFFSERGKYALLTPGHFNETGGFRDVGSSQKYYTGDFPKEYLLANGDLLVAMTEQAPGLLGSTIKVPEAAKYLHNQRLGLIQILDSNVVSKDFLFYLFNSALLRKPISETASGTKVRHTSPTRICDIKALFPKLYEQEQIAGVLTVCDHAIALTEGLIAAKEKRRKWLMQQLLTGKQRLKGFRNPWEEVHIRDIFTKAVHGFLRHPVRMGLSIKPTFLPVQLRVNLLTDTIS